ncbi:TonB-dependent receptor plug domain-containing protein [Idiomarina sp. ST20R2A10]|uniref:TonB-dependent receptor plug domain-containing protein n=1 Tax=Idiomarina sp. ST20R2A10 TaxID=3418369 RepID=UPI003EC53B8E
MNGLRQFALSPLFLTLFLATGATAETNEDPIETIVVTATGSERSALLAPASLSVISRDDLQNVSDQQLITALRKTAGISLSGRGVGGRKVIQLRGLESKHSLILIDGKRVSATDDVVGHSDFQYEWLPLDSIERIEVIRGPMSSLYGSEALGGVINIITRAGQPDASSSLMVNGTMDNEDAGGGQYGLNGQWVQPLTESLTLKAHLGHKYQDDVMDTENVRVSSLEGRRTNTAQLGFDWKLNDEHSLDIEYLTANEERWQHTNYRGNEPYYRSWYDLKREQLSTFWNANFSQWTGQVGYYRSSIDVINKNDSAAVSAYTPQFLTDDVFEARFYRDFGVSRLTMGGEWRDEELEHNAFNGGGDSAVHKSVLAQYETDLVDDVYLTLGGRWDHHEYFGGEFSPRVYMVWAVTPNLSIKTGYGHGFKAPTLKQISPEYRFDGPHSFLGNENLNPETSDSWELGLRYEGAKSTISATVFHNQIEDLISTLCVENCAGRFGHVNRYVNVEEAEVTGFEFEGSYQLFEALELTNSYTYTDGENKTSGERLTSRPKHQGTIGLNIDWIPSTLSSSIDWQYIGEQWIASYTGMTELPDYSLLNANLSYFWGEHRLTLSASNLTDTDLLEKSDSFGYQEHGRSIDLTWYWQF